VKLQGNPKAKISPKHTKAGKPNISVMLTMFIFGDTPLFFIGYVWILFLGIHVAHVEDMAERSPIISAGARAIWEKFHPSSTFGPEKRKSVVSARDF
jgi:hypothetical protein